MAYATLGTLKIEDMSLLMAIAKAHGLQNRFHATGNHGLTGQQAANYRVEWKLWATVSIPQGVKNAKMPTV